LGKFFAVYAVERVQYVPLFIGIYFTQSSLTSSCSGAHSEARPKGYRESAAHLQIVPDRDKNKERAPRLQSPALGDC